MAQKYFYVQKINHYIKNNMYVLFYQFFAKIKCMSELFLFFFSDST